MKPVLITSSILILVIAALRPLLRGRIDPRAQYALWLVAALRLLLPVELAPSAYSALALLERAERPAQVAQAIGQTTVPVPSMSYEDAYLQALREYQQEETVTTSFTDLDRVETRAQELMAHSPTLSELAAQYARPVWLGGAALAGIWFLLVNFRLRRRLRRALPVEAYCPLPVYVTAELPSPCLCGALRPAIYVTPAAMEDPDRLRHVLAHELTHYRHRDHWWARVRCLCLCVYWFDPLVWLAAALSRQDCELACDEGAIRRLGEGERIPYGRTLVGMIAAGRTPLLQTATTMTGGKRRVRERIRLIARRPKTVLAVALALVLVLGAAVGCTFTGAPDDASNLGSWDPSSVEANLTFSLETDSDGSAYVRIDGAVDGVELTQGAFWEPSWRGMMTKEFSYGHVSLVYPPFTDGIEGQLTAGWSDEDHTEVVLTTEMTALLSSYMPTGWWEFAVDLDRGEVTSMESPTLEVTSEGALAGKEVRMYPTSISNEEAVRAAIAWSGE